MDTNFIYKKILKKIQKFKFKELQIELLNNFSFFVILFLSGFFFLSLLETIFGFEKFVRTGFYFSFILFCSVFILFKIIPTIAKIVGIFKTKSEEKIAEFVGNFFPEVKDELKNSIQLIKQKNENAKLYSLDLIDASLLNTWKKVEHLNFLSALDKSQIKKNFKIIFFVFVFVEIIFFFSSSLQNGFYRIVNYSTEFKNFDAITFEISPQNVEIVKGNSLPVSIKVKKNGNYLKGNFSLKFFSRKEFQKKIETQVLTQNANGIFKTELSFLKSPTFYFVEFDGIKSDEYLISVLDKLFLKNFQVEIIPPSYTNFPKQIFGENIGDITSYKGTKVNLKISANKEIQKGKINFSDSTEKTFKCENKNAFASFNLTESKTYSIEVFDKQNFKNESPIEYKIQVLQDEFPSIQILFPAKDINADESMNLNFQLKIKDDFGFSNVLFYHKLASSKFSKPEENFHSTAISFPRTSLNFFDFSYLWDFANKNYVPEDVIEYYFEVFDNDNVSGPKSSRSEMYKLRLPSFEEVFAEAEKNQTETIANLQDIKKEVEKAKEELEKLQIDLKKNPNVDWNKQKQAENIANKYQNLQEKVSAAQKNFEEMLNQMQQNSILSPETMQKYDELQKLMKELDSPEFREALKKLQQQNQLTSEQIKETMKNVSKNEEAFRNNLERMLELFKRLAVEQKMDELIKKAEKLAQSQHELKKETEKSNDKNNSQTISQKQDELKKQTENLQNESKELEQKMDDFKNEMPEDKVQKANENLKQKSPKQKMQKASESLQNGDKNMSMQMQQEASDDLENFANEMKNIQKEMRENQMQEIVNALKKQLDNVIELSKQQEELKNETKQLDPNSQKFRENAQTQSSFFSTAKSIANNIVSLSKKNFAITPELGKSLGDAINQMQSAIQGMGNRNPNFTSQQQSNAMSSLNRTASMLQNSLQSMQKGGGSGGSGLMQQLGQMAQSQQGINDATKGSMGSGSGQMTMEQAAGMSRLAKEQSHLQKSMEQLAEESRQIDDGSKMLGELNDIAKQMQEVVKDMESGSITDETLRKQERIFSRLLESQKSMREKDFENKRKSQSGQNNFTTSPNEMNLRTQQNQIQNDLLKALQEKYSKDYEILIRKYFEALQKIEQKLN